jgi:hypothetical protein
MFHVKPTEGEEKMTSTAAPVVEIPLSVRDNSEAVTDYAFMRHMSPGRGIVDPVTRDQQLRIYREYISHAYTRFAWSGTNPDGQRCRFDMVVSNDNGAVVALFHTEYFTRVACLSDCAGYAQAYASVTDQDGVTTVASPYCGECLHHLRRSADDSGMTLNLSEPLLIGQHD